MRVIACYGTRPEKIKIMPVVEALRAKGVTVTEWNSGQQRDLLERQDDDLCDNWQSGVTGGIAATMEEFRFLLTEIDPVDCVIVQGDTATAFACAQAAFLARIPVAHVEAGLRTYASEPWPEEAFRRQIAAVASYHFAPDDDAACNLLRDLGWRDEVYMEEYGNDESCVEWAREQSKVYVVGNTVIDTLPRIPFKVLVTLHRRENWGQRIQNALDVLAEFVKANSNISVGVINHPNWARQELLISSHLNVQPPQPREILLQLMQESDLIVTDSGGLQEEAAHFGIPCICIRTSTERVALERAGAVEMIDPDSTSALSDALERHLARRRCYGDGRAGEKIAEILVRELASTEKGGDERAA